MTELETMFADGFAEVERVFRPTTGAVTITAGGVTKSCVFSNVDQQRELRENGYRADYDAVAEISRVDATALGLYPMEDGARPQCVASGKNYERHGIEDDPHDSFVRLHLKARKR